MKANTIISPELLNNKDDFSAEYFNQFNLRNAASPLKLNKSITKDYLFPTFYGDVSCSIGVFLCDYQAALEQLPNASMKPVKMPGGRALVTISCYEYKKVLGVAPYNEIAVTIPIQVNPSFDLPVLPIIAEKLFSGFGYHVIHMPVTSLENQIRGLKIWGLPKVVNDIDIAIDDKSSTTTAIDEHGNRYLSLTIPTQGKSTQFDVRSNLYSVLNGEMKQSETCFNGNFNVTKNMGQLLSKASKGQAALMLGEGEQADTLRELMINPVPFQTRFCSGMNACFDLPNPNY
ncbi:acetoacetate decarboxylase family protein [Litorilituus lipolyticus]|uniref:Acetoacetate decarboxylase n=1 Tax=Litorilituus lipolyticus TaxID=2491017 RepID=A0A502KSJ7_9GAMM|nr:acetoacetate decarboxylase family protein [Litorilituus lipolyticus]TPH14618.1 hypothetical protein EPA86_10985 [Litorilituus lipolyticus]